MRKIASLLLLLVLAACQASPALETNTLQPLKVTVSSSLAWLEPDLADCAASVGAAVARTDDSAAEADVIRLQLGRFSGEGYAAILGQDQLTVIVNPANPVTELPIETVRAIFAGREKAWADQSEIQVWSLPQSNDAAAAFADAGFTVLGAGLAPTAQDMRTAVAADPAAIGFLPAHWLDDSVRALPVAGLDTGLPILAITAQEPQGTARALLACLQERIGQ